MVKYEVNKRKLPRKKDDFLIMKGILRAITERFAISSELVDVSIDKFNNYYEQLIEGGAIVRVNKSTEFSPENFNLTEKGNKLLRAPKLTKEASMVFKIPFFEFKASIKKDS